MKRGETRLQGGGYFDQPVTFYNMVETVDGAGGPIRTPAKAYDAKACIGPYQGMELRDALRTIGETWAVFHIRYHRSRIPVEGMTVTHKLTGDNYEVRGVEPIDWNRKVVECTCRLIR
jgi:head-tail adaptor